MKHNLEIQRAGPEHRPRFFIATALLWCIFILSMAPGMLQARVIAVLKSDDLAAYSAPIESFTQAINARVVTYDLGGDLEKGKQIAQQLAQVPPDLILALGAKAAYSARKYITQVPVVYAMVLNPEKYQLTQPNMTGITIEIPPETVFTQYRMFAPEISRVGVIYGTATEELVKRAEKAASSLGILLVRAQVADPREVGEAFDRIRDMIDSLWMVPDTTVLTEETFRLLLQKTKSRKIPYLAYSDNFVKAGAFVSVSPDYRTIGSQAASIARQILDDKTSPAAIPPAPPIGTHLTVNLQTAKALDLHLDPLVMAFADEIIGERPAERSTHDKP